VIALCAEHRIAIVPQGGNTSLSGGSVPLPQGQQIVINLSRMNKIHALDTTNYTLTVAAGCTLAKVREAAEQANRLFPLGLTAIATQCEIGGNISTIDPAR
jgi:FAD/FMN-containing dehydrogenase